MVVRTRHWVRFDGSLLWGAIHFIYTDGVTEAEDVNKNQFGEDKLIEFANSMSPDTSSEAFVEKLYEAVNEFAKDTEQSDDITIMSVRV